MPAFAAAVFLALQIYPVMAGAQTAQDEHTEQAALIDLVEQQIRYYYGGWMENTALISEESDWLSGKDIYINYFGTGIEGFSAKAFDLRIWENGPENSSVSYWNEFADPSSCTEAGYKVRTCLLCGVSEQMDELPPSGHNSVLTESLDPGCDTEGVKTFVCTNCGDTQTETEPVICADSQTRILSWEMWTEIKHSPTMMRCWFSAHRLALRL